MIPIMSLRFLELIKHVFFGKMKGDAILKH